jgi:hypothetical protein
MNFDPALLLAVEKVSAQYVAVHDEVWRIWMEHMVFTWHWWADLLMAVLPWVIWLIVRDKRDTHNLLYAGLFAMLVAVLLDTLGVSQDAWHYNTWLLPLLPEYLPWDLTMMPVITMLFYQFYPNVNPWIKSVVYGLIASFAVEPLFIAMSFYKQGTWEHYFSFPIYIVIYLIGYWLYTRKKRMVPAT